LGVISYKSVVISLEVTLQTQKRWDSFRSV